jgi:uncharacterized OB-fold protein
MTGAEEEPLDAPFWAGLDETRIVLQHCDRCGYVRWPCAEICPECLCSSAEWRTLVGEGTIWSHATYHRSFQPRMEGRVPYVVAVVRLAEGPLFVGQVVNPETGCAIGASVAFETLRIDEETTPAWRILVQ